MADFLLPIYGNHRSRHNWNLTKNPSKDFQALESANRITNLQRIFKKFFYCCSITVSPFSPITLPCPAHPPIPQKENACQIAPLVLLGGKRVHDTTALEFKPTYNELEFGQYNFGSFTQNLLSLKEEKSWSAISH